MSSNCQLSSFVKSKFTGIPQDFIVWLILWVFSIVCLMLVSPDSYLHDMTHRHDSAWFFMAGKAWFNGLTPYVDFSDSKGLFLWLIYGIGYLVTPTSYIGVFWLSCIAYAFTLFFCYKIGALLLGSRRQGMVTAMLMMIPYMLCWFHYETRAEDWCHPFSAAALLALLRVAVLKGRANLRSAGLTVGVGIAATLLIKWSVAVMMLGIAASILGILILRRGAWLRSLLWMLAGFAAFTLPFILYMLHKGILDDCIREYFLLTAQTVSQSDLYHTCGMYWSEMKRLVLTNRIIYVGYLFAAFMWWWKHREVTIFPFLCAGLFLAISINHDFGYYITIASTSAIWAVLWLQKAFSSVTLTNRRLAVLSLGCIAVVSLNLISQDNLVWQQSQRRDQFNAINALMNTKEHPRILHSAHETGLGITAEALPAIKYWAMQSGGYETVHIAQYEAVSNGIPDFVTVQQDGFAEDFSRVIAESGLYGKCLCYNNHNGYVIEVWQKL